jgi:hypothetical protein
MSGPSKNSLHVFGGVDPVTGRAVGMIVPVVAGRVGDQLVKWFGSEFEMRSEISRITRELEAAGVADFVAASGPGSL